MLVLVVGCGSIGKRHIRNLQSLEKWDIIAHDLEPGRCREVEEQCGVSTYGNLKEALTQGPDVTFICTPTGRHIPPALAAAHSGSHLFIEKPLSHSLDGVDELIETVTQQDLVALVGCNMRFHPGVTRMKELLEKGSIGRIISARVQSGQYLPDWHPWEDYRQAYSANKSLGGGAILDGVHEIDYITWFLGEVSRVVCFSGKLSSLETDTEDTAEILLRLKSGTVAEVHLDYVQRTYGRSCQIIGEEGTVLWDFNERQVKLYSTKTEEWQTFAQEPGYDINQMYIEELKHFIQCLEGKAETMQDLKAGKRILEIALAAKESSETGKVIQL